MDMEAQISQEQGEPFKRINTVAAKELIEGGGVTVIDVRNPDEYEAGHVPGAKLIPVDDLFGRVDELEGDKQLLFVCAVGVRSALACEVAAACGHSDLYNLEGGTEAWIGSEYPVET